MTTATAQRVRVRSALDRAAATLTAAGVPSPAADARTLAAAALGVDRLVLALLPDVPAGFEERLDRLVARRAAREPLQLVLGRTWFDGLELEVAAGVFIPRPETELLVDAAARRLGAARRFGAARRREPLVLDLCAGSGAIALAVAARLPSARVVGIDASPDAVSLARRNAHRLGLAGRAAFVAGDATDLAAVRALLARHPGEGCRPDAVLTNPPYVPARAEEAPPLEPEVARYDPPTALWGGGPDGLAIPRAVLDVASGLLGPGGLLLMEHDDTQGAALAAAARAGERWSAIRTVPDLAGRDRFLEAVAGP